MHADGRHDGEMRSGRRALVLAFDGVIVHSLFEVHDRTERALGLPPGTLTWRGPFDPDSDGLWQALEAGQISERDYWQERAREVGALLGETWTGPAALFGRAWGEDPNRMVRPEALAAVEEARALGARLAVLANQLDLFHGPDARERFAILARFDAVLDGSWSGLLKPQRAAYAAVAGALGVALGECVFLDTRPRHLAGAEAAGMHALAFDPLRPGASFRAALDLLRHADAPSGG